AEAPAGGSSPPRPPRRPPGQACRQDRDPEGPPRVPAGGLAGVPAAGVLRVGGTGRCRAARNAWTAGSAVRSDAGAAALVGVPRLPHNAGAGAGTPGARGGMSRSALAATFRDGIGTAPAAYGLDWHLGLAAARLRQGRVEAAGGRGHGWVVEGVPEAVRGVAQGAVGRVLKLTAFRKTTIDQDESSQLLRRGRRTITAS